MLDKEEHVELFEAIEETPIEPEIKDVEKEQGEFAEQTEEPQQAPKEPEKPTFQETTYDNIDTSASENW